ncbi:MAG TPA: hydroxymethylbilane synthase [Candidatus Dormibacteraeota bacterium]|nr:hydroxymethylbilane synthase [Candidatus Dormibacteraeota bacterium]
MIKIVIGTRGSELARAQARLAEQALREQWPDLSIETKIVRTKGDESGSRAGTSLHGRKGLFTAEIEKALLAGDVDLAVHSAKDLPSELTAGTEIVAVLPRAALDDVLVSKRRGDLVALREVATIATGSVRRRNQLAWKHPGLMIVDLRGNVPTRLRKLAENNWDAIVLARAGLERLALSPAQTEITFEGRQFFIEVLPRESFLPAGGQGVIALQIRAGDEDMRTIVDSVNDHETLLCLRAEREFLRLLHGDCNSPVGVLATIENGVMKLRAQVFDQLSVPPREGRVEGTRDDGEGLAGELLRQINGESE